MNTYDISADPTRLDLDAIHAPDHATFAYRADVYILEVHRGRGLSHRLVDHVLAHPDLQSLRRVMLATRDAHGLYASHGFVPLAAPGRFMEIHRPDPYRAA